MESASQPRRVLLCVSASIAAGRTWGPHRSSGQIPKHGRKSTGRMGSALARAAKARGARVILDCAERRFPGEARAAARS